MSPNYEHLTLSCRIYMPQGYCHSLKKAIFEVIIFFHHLCFLTSRVKARGVFDFKCCNLSYDNPDNLRIIKGRNYLDYFVVERF